MPMEIKYHLDESVANAVANGLKHRGIDVTTSKAAGLIGASDLEQLGFAMRDTEHLSRTMMTFCESMPREQSTLESRTPIRSD